LIRLRHRDGKRLDQPQKLFPAESGLDDARPQDLEVHLQAGEQQRKPPFAPNVANANGPDRPALAVDENELSLRKSQREHTTSLCRSKSVDLTIHAIAMKFTRFRLAESRAVLWFFGQQWANVRIRGRPLTRIG
jgi:hypothetical protein